MLIDVIASFLTFSHQQAASLMDLLALEKAWSQQSLNTLHSQTEIAGFLQRFAQQTWFKGHDRSKLPDNQVSKQLLSQYYKIFTELGLTKAIAYPKKSAVSVAAVLGSTASQMHTRLVTLKKDLLSGCLPIEKIIFGLACNRPLHESAYDSELTAKAQLQSANLPLTEMNLLNLLMENLLAELRKKNVVFTSLKYWPIETISFLPSRADINCVKTADTAISLKRILENKFKGSNNLSLSFYSQQPYLLRQQRDIQVKLNNCKIFVVGSMLSEEDFYNNTKSLAICLGEVARIINISYEQNATSPVPIKDEERGVKDD